MIEILIRIKYIIIGFWNLLRHKLGLISYKKQKLFEKRLLICQGCIYHSKNKCTLCGCDIYAKTKSNYKLDKKGKSIDGCPKRYW